MPTEKQYADFGRAVIKKWDFENDIDGGDIQEWGLQCGLLVPTKYDPEKHGRLTYSDQGDEIYVLNEEPTDA